ncbi:MAG: ExbD/TolR family protein [Betaproteobacteria bacterium]
MSDINVVPYIDVMLVLLVIFMVTAPMINTGQVELPQVSRSSALPTKPIEIEVTGTTQVRVRDGTTASARVVNLTELAAYLQARQAESPGQRPVLIAAAPSVSYGKVMEVMDLLQRAKVEKIGLLARPRSN